MGRCALLLAGCVAPSGDRGVKLSDAMKASSQGNNSDLGGGSNPGSVGDGGVTVLAPEGTLSGASYNKKDFDFQILTDVSYQRPLNGPINSLTHFTLTPVGLEDEHNFLGAYIGGGTVDLKSGSLANQAIQDISTLDAGLTYRYYLGPSWTGFCPYMGCSLGGTLLLWSYRHSVIAGGDTISSDNLEGVEGTVAVGISTHRNQHLSCFVEAGLGGNALYDTTTQGFQNDVFNDFGYLFIKADLCVKF